MTAPGSHSASNPTPGPRADLIALGSSVQVAEGEMVPAVLTVRVGRLIDVNMPLGAFVVRGGTPCFVSSFDFVGLTAVVLGIGIGGLGVWKARPIIRAVADKIRAS